jgi:hypothetical protein
MFKYILAPALCAILAVNTAAAQEISDVDAWEAAKESATSTEVFAFIEKYPNSEFAKEAKSYMIDLLWVELAANAPESVPDNAIKQPATAIVFNVPLTEGTPDVLGKSLEELIAGTPLYPPVEGLPEEYWKTQECSNCHQWEKANLCTQANSYLSDAGAANLTKPHPYGGTFKLNLRDWAQNGCE